MSLLNVVLATFDGPAMATSPPPEQARRQRERRVRPARFLLGALSHIAPGAKPRVQKALIRAGYHLVSARSRDDATTFMNYGYASLAAGEPLLMLADGDKANRYSIQLYHHVTAAIDLQDKDVLEVGCGRGGGSAFIKRYLYPRSVTGIDLAGEAIKFCRRQYPIDGLLFQQGDAENLPFPANTFDVVVNVESSHCYPSIQRFFDEVHRVLRPGGHFVLADMRPQGDIDLLYEQLQRAGMVVQQQEDITANVVHALELDSERRQALIQDSMPAFLHTIAREFLAVKSSSVYEALCTGSLKYLCFIVRKPEMARN